SRTYPIHVMHHGGWPAPAIYDSRPGTTISSIRVRRQLERDVLAAHGDAIHVISLQGDIEFAGAESILWCLDALGTGGQELGWLALDLQRVTRLRPVAAGMLERTLRNPALSRTTIVAAGANGNLVPGLRIEGSMETSSLEEALEWCEDALLQRHGALL